MTRPLRMRRSSMEHSCQYARSHETGLEHFLFYQTLDGARDGEEFGAATLAGTGEIDAHDLLDPPGTGRHDHDVVGQVERLADAVGDEDDRLPLGEPDLEQLLLHDLPCLRVEGAQGT